MTYRVLVSIVGISLSLFIGQGTVFAQSALADAAAYQARLQSDYDQAVKEREALMTERKKITDQRDLIRQDIAIINAQIREAQAKIAVRTATINSLSKDIDQKAESIEELSLKLERSAASLAELVRKTSENDEVSPAHILLGKNSFSEFFIEVDSFQTLKGALNASIDDVPIS